MLTCNLHNKSGEAAVPRTSNMIVGNIKVDLVTINLFYVFFFFSYDVANE